MPKTAARAALALLALAAGAAAPPRASALPTRATITVDGDDSDWELVLLNPENTSRDDDGSTLGCADSSDRDCPVPSPEQDLAHFAWTTDNRSLSFLVERYGAGAADLLIYIDLDGDGFMELNEPVVRVPLAPSPGSLNGAGLEYRPIEPTGDPLASPEGLTDGWSLPGSLAGAGAITGTAQQVDPDGRIFELSVPLGPGGLAGAPALRFHVSVASSLSPVRIGDNQASRVEGGDSTAYRLLRLDAPATAAGVPGSSVELSHVIANESTLPTRVRLRAVTSTPLAVEIWSDRDGDGVAETWLGLDAQGDGDLLGPSDALSPEGDEDLDGVPDLGRLAPGEQRRVLLRIELPPDSGGLVASLELRADAAEDPSVASELVDAILAGSVTVEAPPPALGSPDDVAWLRHVIRRNDAGSGPLDLWAKSDEDWPLVLREDALGTGELEDAVPVIDSDASGLPDVVLGTGDARIVWLRVDIPPDAPLGTVDRPLLRALEAGLPVADGRSRLTVVPPVQLVPDHRVETGDALRGAPGESIWFAHRLIHALGSDGLVALEAQTELGWEASLHLDPDGDGRPFDAQPLAEPVLVRPGPNGGELSLLVRVDVPRSVTNGDLARLSLVASPAAAVDRTATALDDAIASIVRTYEDETHLVAVSRVGACTTVHALASGLPSSTPGYRFVWRSAGGAPLRLLETATDANGRCSDAWTPEVGERGEGFRIDIQERDGAAWSTLDSAPFAVDELGDADGPLVVGAPHHLEGRELRAETALRNGSESLPVAGLELRWVALSPDGAAYLDAGGGFLPWTGAEWTQRELVDLEPGELRVRHLEVAAVDYPVEGDYALRVLLSSGCGELAVFAETSFEVIDDADGDGLRRADEIAAGTDPLDADSDDDGLADGEDGLLDSDADGLLDALDCDSDGDGLGDGLEAGRWEPLPDTEVAAGCFRPDLWPLSTTDPDRADSDGGGVPDGLEDANGNGRIDAGETDPNVGADDPPCDPAPPPEVGGLRLGREGQQGLLLRWDPLGLDPCSTYRLLSGASPSALEPDGPTSREDSALRDAGSGAGYWLVVAESALAGRGPTGR